MLDNLLIKLILRVLVEGEATAGISGTPIKQAFQPTQQGVNTGPTAYIYKVGDRRLGFPRRADLWDMDNAVITHTETQQYETTFQISALSTQDPANTAQMTASDILNLIAHILQSDAAVAALQAEGVGIERVTNVRNPYFVNDRQRHEASPSFDFVVTHKQIVTSTTPIVRATELQIKTV